MGIKPSVASHSCIFRLNPYFIVSQVQLGVTSAAKREQKRATSRRNVHFKVRFIHYEHLPRCKPLGHSGLPPRRRPQLKQTPVSFTLQRQSTNFIRIIAIHKSYNSSFISYTPASVDFEKSDFIPISDRLLGLIR